MGAHMDETLLQLRTDKGGDMSNEHALQVEKEEFLRSRDGFNLDADSAPVSSSVNEPAGRKHSHYFKDVSKYNEADVYRVCQMFDINDPSGATQHAIKKLLLSGCRGGGKDRCKDLQEAIDTMSRLLEMMREDAA